MQRIVLLGGGGHASVVVEILRQMPDVDVVGALSPDATAHGLDVPRLGCDADLPDVIVRERLTGAVAAVGDNLLRRSLFQRIVASGLPVFSAVHRTAAISPSATIGRGVVIMPHVVINARSRIGDNVILNTSATIDHHAAIGDHVHIAPGCHLAGNVSVGELSLVGIGACVTPGVRIGGRVLIGAGTAVTRDVVDDVRLTRG